MRSAFLVNFSRKSGYACHCHICMAGRLPCHRRLLVSAWTHSTVYPFSDDEGFIPRADLIFDKEGALYSTAVCGARRERFRWR